MKQQLIALFFASILYAAFCCVSASGLAQPAISYQGVLLDASAKPVSGPHLLNIAIYNTASGGSALFTEVENTTLNNGLFSVLIGSQNSLKQSLDFTKQYYL